MSMNDPAIRRALEPSEDDFLGLVRERARLGRWLEYHTHDSRRSPEGFPDLVLVRAGRLVFAELKVKARQPTPAQVRWRAALADVPGVEAYVWRPENWDEIVQVLT